VKLQSRVLDNIQKELEELALMKVKIASPVKKRRAAVSV
jgi:RNA-binding protein YhbY